MTDVKFYFYMTFLPSSLYFCFSVGFDEIFPLIFSAKFDHFDILSDNEVSISNIFMFEEFKRYAGVFGKPEEIDLDRLDRYLDT